MIGNRLKEIRTKQNRTTKEMADFLNLPQVSYIKYERNERVPDIVRLKEMANKLEVSIDYLLENSSYPKIADFYADFLEREYRPIIDQLSDAQKVITEINHRLFTECGIKLIQKDD